MKQIQQGFTLIELMIVVAIIGILAAIALPAYSDYTNRAKMSEVILAASSGRTTLAEFYQTNGSMPADATNAGIDAGSSGSPLSNYVESIAYTLVGTTGVITVVATGTGVATIDGQAITLIGTGNATSGTVAWACGPATTGGVDRKYLPASCRL